MTNGIILSSGIGTVDYATLKANGTWCSFAVVLDDAAYATHVAGLKAQSIPCGALHAFDAAKDAATQAATFLALAAPKTGELLPAVLVPDGLTDTSGLQTYVTAVDAALGGKHSLIQAPLTFTGGAPFAANGLWLIDFADAIGDPAPTVQSPWTTWALWRYTDGGHVDGAYVGCVPFVELAGGDLSIITL